MRYEKLFEYYKDQDVLPTYARLHSRSSLSQYARQRRDGFTNKLKLSPSRFRGAELIEFGPDSGENALVFALWGARCTLVEPNKKAHPLIRAYFRRYGLSGHLRRLYSLDVAEFASVWRNERRFDVVDAEGFIYTVRPTRLWARLFGRLLREDGHAIITYLEATGCFFELLLKVIHANVSRETGADPMETAHLLFGPKWNSIPHTREIDSWVMDVLLNPFVRLKFMIEPCSLSATMFREGFVAYATWPSYACDGYLDWFKKPWDYAKQLGLIQENVRRSRLSHLFGSEHLLRAPMPSLERTLFRLLRDIDLLIDGWEMGLFNRCLKHLAEVDKLLSSGEILVNRQDLSRSKRVLLSTRRILEALGKRNVHEVTRICRTDDAFIQTWGMTTHHVVFRKRGPS